MVLAPIAYAANTPSEVWIGVVQHRQRARHPGPALAALPLACRTRSATAVENSRESGGLAKLAPTLGTVGAVDAPVDARGIRSTTTRASWLRTPARVLPPAR